MGDFNKDILTFAEFCKYLGISKGYGYFLTHKKIVPFYKPNGKKIYFLKSEIDKWLLTNRVVPNSEIEQQATDFVLKPKKQKKNGK